MRFYINDGTDGLPGTMFFETTSPNEYISNETDSKITVTFSGFEVNVPDSFTIAFGFGNTAGSGVGVAIYSNGTPAMGTTDWGVDTHWDDEVGTEHGWALTDTTRNLNIRIWAGSISDKCGDTGTDYLTTDLSGPDGVADCYVNLYDLIVFTEQWLGCTIPGGCQ